MGFGAAIGEAPVVATIRRSDRGSMPSTASCACTPPRRSFTALPGPERHRIAVDVREAHRLLATQPSGPDRAAFDWAVQHARVLVQTVTLLSYDFADPQQVPQAMRYRDELMADNTAWWRRHTGQKILLSAHNGHTGYRT